MAVPPMETIADVERKVGAGQYQLWLSDNSAAVTAIQVYPLKKAVTVIHGGGDLGELVDKIEPALCDYALMMGCSAVMGTGRKGWERTLLGRGYEFAWLTMHKDLINGR